VGRPKNGCRRCREQQEWMAMRVASLTPAASTNAATAAAAAPPKKKQPACCNGTSPQHQCRVGWAAAAALAALTSLRTRSIKPSRTAGPCLLYPMAQLLPDPLC